MSVHLTVDLLDKNGVTRAVDRIAVLKGQLKSTADYAALFLVNEAFDVAYNTAHECTGDLRRAFHVDKVDNGHYVLVNDVEATTLNPLCPSFSKRVREVSRHVHYASAHESYLKRTTGMGYMEAAGHHINVESLPMAKELMSFF